MSDYIVHRRKNRADKVIGELVRCKECRWWVGNISEDDGIYEDECKWITEEAPNANDYCSYGERKGSE